MKLKRLNAFLVSLIIFFNLFPVITFASENNSTNAVQEFVQEIEPQEDTIEPTYFVDFRGKAAVSYAKDTYVSSWTGVTSSGTYNNKSFDLFLVGGTSTADAGVYRPNGSSRNLVTQNSNGSILVQAPFRIEVLMSTESNTTSGTAIFIVKGGSTSGTELGRVSTEKSFKDENMNKYTIEYNGTDKQQLFFEVNRGDTGSRACIYTIAIYEDFGNPIIKEPTINILKNPTNIITSKDRVTSNTSLQVVAETQKMTNTSLSYQWYSSSDDNYNNPTIISGAISPIYQIPSHIPVGTYYYYCVITGHKDDGTPITKSTRISTVKISENIIKTQWGENPIVEWKYDFQRVSLMAENPKMYLNDVQLPIDHNNENLVPILQNSVLLVPFETTKLALGNNITWHIDESGSIITATYNHKTVELTLNSFIMKWENNNIILDAPPELIDNVLYLPIAAIGNALGEASIGWDPTANVITITTGAIVSQSPVGHGAMNSQAQQWYGSPESLRLADNLLLFQRNSGGWYKNVDFAVEMTDELRAELISSKNTTDATIDNGATIPEIQYLIKTYQATKIERYRDAYMMGLNGVLSAQYGNGGFPQYIDQRDSYHGEITFNDDAMTHILKFWESILKNPDNYYSMNASTKDRIVDSLYRAIDVILKTQIYSEEQEMLTAWCAQHYRDTLLPSWARAYEPPSISGSESVGVLEFLVELDQPFLAWLDTENNISSSNSTWSRVEKSIHAAVAFFKKVEIFDLQQTTATSPWGSNKVLVEKADARGLWARFIDINTFEPLFVDRPDRVNGKNDPIKFKTDPDESLTYGEINSGFMIEYKHSPEGGGNLRNVYKGDGSLDIINSYARLSFERRNGYQFIGDYGLAIPSLYNAWLVKNNLSVPVSEITGIYSTMTKGKVTLNPIILPSNASKQNIVWEIIDKGETGAIVANNQLTTFKAGTLKLRATIIGGALNNTNFIQEFVVQIKDNIPVTNIDGVPSFLPIGTYNMNRVSVSPSNASNSNIVWNIVDDGGTNAYINGNTITTTADGTVTVSATIANGISNTAPYVQSFDILIHKDPSNDISQYLSEDAFITDWKVLSTTLSNAGTWSTAYRKNFGINSPLYVDRSHAGTFNVSQLPDTFVGLDWIQTSNDARNNALNSSQMMFTVKKDVFIYLAAEMRIDMSRIGWIDNSWEFMGNDLYMRNSENQIGYDKFLGVANSGYGKHYFYKKFYKAGDIVRLGGINQGTGLGNMMFVIDPNPIFSISYDGNGATTGLPPIDNNKYKRNDVVTVLSNSGNLNKIGYTFEGWATKENPEILYKPGSNMVVDSFDITLYAVWTPNKVNPTPPPFENNDDDTESSSSNDNYAENSSKDNSSEKTFTVVQNQTISQIISNIKVIESNNKEQSKIYEVATKGTDTGIIISAETYKKVLAENISNIKVKLGIIDVNIPMEILLSINTAENPKDLKLIFSNLKSSDFSDTSTDAIVNDAIKIFSIDFYVDNLKITQNLNGLFTITLPVSASDISMLNVNNIFVTGFNSDAKGNLIKQNIPVVYDKTKGTLQFTTSHLRTFAINQGNVTFNDLSHVLWAKDSINSLASKGVIIGRSEMMYDPLANVTRAEFSALIGRMLGVDTATVKINNQFNDIDSFNWYANHVNGIYSIGLEIKGRNNGIFDPNTNITREEMFSAMASILRKFGYKNISDNNLDRFIDNKDISQYAKTDIELLANNGLISGKGEPNILSPKDNTTRAEAAVIIERLLNFMYK